MSRPVYDAIIVGGGVYGCLLAVHLKRNGARGVLLLEREPAILRRASYANQARVHNGYHYPRSLLTALRSRVNLPRFAADYADCIDDGFEKYYAIGRIFSNVTARQFEVFCDRIGAPLDPAPPEVRELFNPEFIEAVFRVREFAFDAVRLARRVARELKAHGVELALAAEARRVAPAGEGLEVVWEQAGRDCRAVAARVFNCTYSRINKLLVDSGLPVVPLKHELTELALVEAPPALRRVGVTVMCGPFFSIMPFPPKGLHTLSHVRYTPHHEWFDTERQRYIDPYAYFDRVPRISSFHRMVQDAQRYLPLMRECRYRGSLWEVKTVLPLSEVDDSRPILLCEGHGLPGLTSVMGSKIDNVYDVMDTISPNPVSRGQ